MVFYAFFIASLNYCQVCSLRKEGICFLQLLLPHVWDFIYFANPFFFNPNLRVSIKRLLILNRWTHCAEQHFISSEELVVSLDIHVISEDRFLGFNMTFLDFSIRVQRLCSSVSTELPRYINLNIIIFCPVVLHFPQGDHYFTEIDVWMVRHRHRCWKERRLEKRP